MTQNGLIEFDGTVTERLAAERYRVRFANGHEVVAYTQDDQPAEMPRLALGMRVVVEISTHDMNLGRLIFRRKIHTMPQHLMKKIVAPSDDMGRVDRLTRERNISRATNHQYGVGDEVSYNGGHFQALQKARNLGGETAAFKIVSRLPDEGGGFQYRIKNVVNGLERIVVEAEVSPVEADASAITVG